MASLSVSLAPAPLPLHPIPEGGKALLGTRRFTVYRTAKLTSTEHPGTDEWGYQVTFDDDASLSKHIVMSDPTTYDIRELTHADPGEMYKFLHTEIHPYSVGDMVKFMDPNDDNRCMAGTVEHVVHTSFSNEDSRYFYKVKLHEEDRRVIRIYNGEKYLSPVNYPLTNTKWAIGEAIVRNKKRGSCLDVEDAPEVEEVYFNYNFDVSSIYF
jgi:hypothetical protein